MNALKPPLSSKRELLKWTLSLLREYDARPKKKLSQCFIVDPRCITELTGYIDGKPTILEIGCGLGTITYHIAKKSRFTVALEIDPRLARIARDVVKPLSEASVVCADALSDPTLIRRYEVIISNVPYHITGPLIFHVLRAGKGKRCVLMLQEDVAVKIIARPGTRRYGRISAMVQLLGEVKLGGLYKPASFYPKPEVSSRILVIDIKRDYDETVLKAEEIARKLFSRRRQKAWKVVRDVYGEDAAAAAAKIIGEKRVYEVTPQELLALTEVLPA